MTSFQPSTRLPADDVNAIVLPSLLTEWFWESHNSATKLRTKGRTLPSNKFGWADPAAFVASSHFRLTRRLVLESTSLAKTSREKSESVVPVTISADVRRVL